MNYKRLLELILLNLDEGIIVTDEKANITFYKEASNNLSGMSANTAIGKNILEVFPGLTTETSTFYNVIKSKKPIIEHIQHYVNYQGKKVSTVTSTIPIIENKKLVGCFEIFKDLTHVMDLSDKIVRLQEQLYSNNNESSSALTRYSFENMIGKSSIMMNLKKNARLVANSKSPIMIYGETGTGKELLTQAIHNSSSRKNKPFIAQNCAALPFNLLESILFGTSAGSFTGAKDNPGLFELADGGTLFLDEINALDIDLQAKLLRVIQDGIVRRIGSIRTKSVDVRIIAAVNEEPIYLVKSKKLREDLYFRLNVIYLEIPPLRKRKEDIPQLCSYFIEKNNKMLGKNITGLSDDVFYTFDKYNWPGNVRELEYIIESAMNFALGNTLQIEDIRYNFHNNILVEEDTKAEIGDFDEEIDLNEALSQYEIGIIKKAMLKADGSLTNAAKTLGIPKQTLYNKLKKYNLRIVKHIE